jgi:hypothetical protein
VALVRTDVSEEPGAHGVTTQKTPFFIVTAVKTSNLTIWTLFSKPLATIHERYTSTIQVSKFSESIST